MSDNNDGLVDLLHSKGIYACDQVAFRMTVRPAPGDPVHTYEVRLVDGSTPDHGTEMVCGTCHRTITPGDVTPDGGWA